MMVGSDCDCLICRLEASLAQELSQEKGFEEYRRWTRSSEVLAGFPTAAELIGHLHRQSEDRNARVDRVMVELVRARGQEPFEPAAESLLLPVFVPTLHRTASQIAATFPSLSREDRAQHLFAALMDFLDSQEVRDEAHAAIFLAKFLDDCQNRGWLSQEERELLTRFKVEGVTGAEIGGRSGHSAVAIRHRVQRLLERLRRVAQQSGGVAEQLELFRP